MTKLSKDDLHASLMPRIDEISILRSGTDSMEDNRPWIVVQETDLSLISIQCISLISHLVLRLMSEGDRY